MRYLIATVALGAGFYVFAHGQLPTILVLSQPSPLDAVATLIFLMFVGAMILAAVVGLYEWAKPR